MVIVFTICSNNYLRMAHVLGESLKQHSPNVRFIIGLVDTTDSNIDYTQLHADEVLPIAQIGIPALDSMTMRYSIVELNTAVKPYLFQYIFTRFSEYSDLRVCYLDPDIAVFTPLEVVLQRLDRADILLTPHILTPIPQDNKFPPENEFLNYGLYNLGFCAVRRSPTSVIMLNWWAQRLRSHCVIDVANGLFVDQLWMNFLPLFFEGVEVCRDPGYNVAYWNLHERRLERRDGIWYVNRDWPLAFFHFSNLPLSETPDITKVSSRYTLNDLPTLRPLFDSYRAKLRSNPFAKYKDVSCTYIDRRNQRQTEQRRAFYWRHPHHLILLLIKRAIPRKFRQLLRGPASFE